MTEKEPLELPFNTVHEFKESMKLELEKILNSDVFQDSKSADDLSCSGVDNDSSKENSFTVCVDDTIVEDVSLLNNENSSALNANKQSSITRSQYNFRATRSRTRNQTKSKLNNVPVAFGYNSVQDTPSRKKGKRNNSKRKEASNSILTASDVIAIDDDDDDSCCIIETTNYCSEKNGVVDPLFINEEVSVKITWLYGGVIKYKLRRFEPFEKIFFQLAEDKKIDINSVVLMKDDVKIQRDDTPDSINLNILDVLIGYSAIKPASGNSETIKKKTDLNTLEIKVITNSKRNNETHFTIKKDQKMLVLFVKIAEQLNYNISDIQLWFDGERVNEEDTTLDLDLEGGECFELRMKS